MKSSFWLRCCFAALMLALICRFDAPNTVFSQSDNRVFVPIVISPAESVQPDAPGSCLSAEEFELGRLINEYRASVGLPAAPFSKSLTMVAQTHVLDLQTNYPGRDWGKDSRGINCNMHTWSDKGYWTPVCYTPDHEYAEGMWFKPREITRGVYTDYGYEISAGYWGKDITAQDALNLWKKSSGHNDVIIEQGAWSGQKWPAMGIGISKTYAVVWFSSTSDPQGPVAVCP